MKVELPIEEEDKLVIFKLRNSLRWLYKLPDAERAPDDPLLRAAIKRVLKFYGG